MENDNEKEDLKSCLIHDDLKNKVVKHNCFYYVFCCYLCNSNQKVFFN